MQWLQDKKNLPIVIAIVAVVLAGAGFMIYSQMKANSPDVNATETNLPTSPSQRADARPVGETGSSGSLPPQTSPSTPTTSPASGPSPSAAPSASPAGASPRTPGGRTGATQTAAVPKPMEAWREDPFLPLGWKPAPPPFHGPVRLNVPMPGPLFHPKPRNIEAERPDLKPQPPRRVAGIIFSQRVTALLQTQDGWETVTPGMTLHDGTLVERIERDRVVLRTTDYHPRLVEVKLAAASLGISSDTSTPSSSATPTAPARRARRPYNPPGSSDM